MSRRPREPTSWHGKFVRGSFTLAWLILEGSTVEARGDEFNPELVDPSGDVTYDPLYLGPRPVTFLDVLSGWIDYENETDRLAFHLKTGDSRSIERRSPENTYSCSLRGAISTEGKTFGNFSVGWGKSVGETAMKSHASYREPDDFVGKTIRHTFAARFGDAGSYVWAVNRSELVRYGDIINNVGGVCDERGSPSQVLLQLYVNRDSASSKSSYSFRELRRLTGPDGAKDPVEAYTPSPEPTNAEPGGDTPNVSFVALFLVLLVAAARLKQPR